MLINSTTRARERFRKVHVIPSELGKTDSEVNKWIDDNRPNIEEIKEITYICLPSDNGMVRTRVIIDYIENNSKDTHPTTNIKVEEVFSSEKEINKSLCAPPIENIGGIRIVDLSAVKGSDYIAALIDYVD